MKKLYITIIIAIHCSIGSAQVIDFPDANFKAALLNHMPAIDSNADGEIQVGEAQLVTQLNISNKNIGSLDGLENFANLVSLNCSFNQLASFDGYNLAHLGDLQCQNNMISMLSIQSMPSLTFLIFDNNQVADIDLHNNPNLSSVWCNNNLLSEINVCGTAVTWLWCASNPNLTHVSVKNNMLSIVLGGRSTAAEPPVGQFDFTNCPLLETICYDEGELQAVEWTLPFSTNITLVTDCPLDCLSLTTRAFEVSANYALAPNPVVDILNIEVTQPNDIQTMSVYNTLGQWVQTFLKSNSGTSITIDVNILKAGTYFMAIQTDKSRSIKKFIKL